MLRVGTKKKGMGEAGEHLRTERDDERRRGQGRGVGRGEGFSSSLRAAANELLAAWATQIGPAPTLFNRGEISWRLILGWLSPIRTTQVRLELDSTPMSRLGLGVYLHCTAGPST